MTKDSSATALTPTHAGAVIAFLEGAGVSFQLLEHAATEAAAAEARVLGLPPDRIAKTIVLHDGHAYVVAAITAADRLDLNKLRNVLGASRQLRLASEDEIGREFPSLEIGAVPPFGPVVPAAEVIDSAIAAQRRIICPAGDHRHSVELDPRDLVRITAARVADISET